MKTRWIWSLETEAQRLVHTAYQIAIGFYQNNGFIVLPPKYVKNNRHIVLYPDIGLETIPNYWKKVLKGDIGSWPVSKDNDLIKDISSVLKKQHLDRPRISQTEIIWQKAQYEIMVKIEEITDRTKKLKNLFVYPSHFGTSVSFNSPKKEERTVELFLRFDQDIFSLVEGILSALLREDLIVNYNASWKERELLVDYLVHSSALSKILRKYSPSSEVIATTAVVQKKQFTKMMGLSSEFLKKIKVPRYETKRFSAKSFSIYFGASRINNLSWKERRALMMLSENKGNIVEEGRLAEIIFKDVDHFSLYAMAKFIQRLREKLEENGIPGNIIETARRRGYVLR